MEGERSIRGMRRRSLRDVQKEVYTRHGGLCLAFANVAVSLQQQDDLVDDLVGVERRKSQPTKT